MIDPDQDVAETDPLTPEARARTPAPAGVPLASGELEWRVQYAGLAPVVAEARDRMYDDSIIRRKVRTDDARLVCYFGLVANYHVTKHEAAAILWRAEAQELVDVAMESLFARAVRRNYSSWARSALIANGIRPADVPAADLSLVLRHLEATGRLEPLDTFTEADEYQGRRAALLNFGGD